MLTGTELAVWGDPIEHSLSPRLHAAAYEALGLGWTYVRRRVDEAGFAEALGGLGPAWRGLSLTMPLKRVGAASAVSLDDRARLTKAANTLLLSGEGPRGFNTDVGGLVAAVREQDVEHVESGRILGAGATAASALVALSELGATRVEVVARRPEAVEPLVDLGSTLGVAVTAADFGAEAVEDVPVTLATLPGGTDLGKAAVPLAAHGGLLVDVVYGSWPSPLALAWQSVGERAVSGRAMLLHQALLQVRIFVTGAPDEPVDGEPLVLSAMRRAVVGD